MPTKADKTALFPVVSLFAHTFLGTLEYCVNQSASLTTLIQESKTVKIRVPTIRGNFDPKTLNLTCTAVTLKRNVIDPIIQRSIDTWQLCGISNARCGDTMHKTAPNVDSYLLQ